MNLDLRPRTRGRAAKPLVAVEVRELREADLALLEVERATKAPEIKRLRQRHHSLARLLAAGLKDGEAAAILGYDPSRVSILKADPAFQQLLRHYTEMRDAEFADMHRRMADLGIEAIEELRERVAENPEDVSSALLLEIATKTADRTGYGPVSSTNVNVNLNLAARLEKARKRVTEAKVIDAEFTEGPKVPTALEHSTSEGLKEEDPEQR